MVKIGLSLVVNFRLSFLFHGDEKERHYPCCSTKKGGTKMGLEAISIKKGTRPNWSEPLFLMVPRPRVELGTRGFSVPCSTGWAISATDLGCIAFRNGSVKHKFRIKAFIHENCWYAFRDCLWRAFKARKKKTIRASAPIFMILWIDWWQKLFMAALFRSDLRNRLKNAHPERWRLPKKRSALFYPWAWVGIDMPFTDA